VCEKNILMNKSYTNIKPFLNYDSLVNSKNILTYTSYENLFSYNKYTETYPSAKKLVSIYSYQNSHNRLISGNDWIIFLSLGLIILYTYIKYAFSHLFNQHLLSVINFQLIRQVINIKSGASQNFSYFLYALFITILSLYSFICLNFFELKVNDSSFYTYFLILALVSFFYLVKFLMYKFIAYLTETKEDTNTILNYYGVHYKILSLILTPLVIMLFYLNKDLVPFFIYLIFSIIVLFSFIRIYRALKIIFQKRFSFFYIFLYLCTIEIMPLIYSIKLLKMWVLKS